MNTPILTLKITLRHTLPRVWRRLTVPANISLVRLHVVIDTAMGWTTSLPHYFADADGTTYSTGGRSATMKDENKTALGSILTAVGDEMTYNLGYEEDWEHEVKLESLGRGRKNSSGIKCTGGERQCPPDGCGGPLGFKDLLENLSIDRALLSAKAARRWDERNFDPTYFDLSPVNAALRRLKRITPGRVSRTLVV
jgi:hypothetical protein